MSNFFQEFPVAIVGMACRLPGARDLKSYWKLLKNGESAIGELPESRLNRELYYDAEKGKLGKSYSLVGGLIPNLRINSVELGLPEDAADHFDEAHLTICDVALKAIRDAKMDPFNLSTRKVGVYIGGTGGSAWAGDLVFSRMIDETSRFLFELPEFKTGSLRQYGRQEIGRIVDELTARVRAKYPDCQRDVCPTLGAHVAGAVINRALGLTGPFMAIDAACASSLKGLILGVNAIQQGRLDMAIVGGASYCKSDSLVLFSQAQSVTANSSRPFDSRADGLVASEGYVALVLKTLPRALADGDPIHAVIRGVGISTDGKGKSLWAPRKEGQILAVQRAYGKTLDIQRLQYIEAHATSTQVGDSTELTALHMALKDHLAPDQTITLGASKGNIGHTLETAGLAGLAKLVLSIQNKTIPPAVNVNELNTEFDWKSAPFEIPRQAVAWDAPKDGHPRRGAVNAFGIGGLNIHVVVDEYQKSAPTSVYMSPSTPGLESQRNEPIAILGMGAIYPGAFTIDAFWKLLVSGEDPKREAPKDRWNKDLCQQPTTDGKRQSFKSLGGYIADYVYDWKVNKVPPKQIANANPLQFMLLDAAAQALKQAGYDQRPFDRKKVGVVVGTMFGGDFSAQLQMGLRLPEFNAILEPILRDRGFPASQIAKIVEEYQEILLARMPALLDETGSFTSSTLASRITKTFDFMGGALALDAAECSGLAAVNAGVEILRSGACDMMLCAGGHRAMDYTIFYAAWKEGWLAEKPYPAFDERRDGAVPGEGVGVVLLKRLSDARRDGDPIRAVIRGIGYSSNVIKPGQAVAPAIRMALQTAKVSPAQVAAIETDGGVKKLEKDELKAFSQVLGSRDRTEPILLGSLAGQLGKSGAAIGMASLMKAAMSLDHGELPVGLPVAKPSADVKQYPGVFKLPKSNEKLISAPDGPSKLISVTTVSGCGQTFGLILERGSTVSNESSFTAKPAESQSVAAEERRATLVLIGAPDLTSLNARLNSVAKFADLAETRSFSAHDRYRLAMIVHNQTDLSRKLELVREHLRGPSKLAELQQNQIFWNDRPQRVRMAWMFCGQGSQYSGVMRRLVSEFGPAAQSMSRIDQALKKFGDLSFAKIAWDESIRLDSDLLKAQLSILLSQHLISESLGAIGVRPQVVAGHSFGEYGAMLAAGAWDIEDAIACAYLRTEAIQGGSGQPGRMLALAATIEAAEQLVNSIGGPLYIANHNSSKQVVLSGTNALIAEAAKLAREKGYPSIVLPVTCPFHSPLMKPAAEIFSNGQNGISVRDARLPLVSTASATLVRSAKELRKSLCDQLTMPVRYLEMTRRIVADGPTLMVEIGPRQVLTKLHRSMGLEESGHLLIATDESNDVGLESLLRIKAIAAVSGALDTQDDRVSVVQQTVTPASATTGSGFLKHFDATERRKQSHRRSAEQNGNGSVSHSDESEEHSPNSMTPTFQELLHCDRSESTADHGHSAGGNGSAHFSAMLGASNSPRHVKESNGHYTNDHSTPSATAVLNGEIVAHDAPLKLQEAELIEFLTEFVIEQTGYPQELVELDADLEADLGIDSIKKAQMMGEIGERFEIAPPSGNVTLDSFPTLRHVINFILQSQPAGNAEIQTSLQSSSKGQANPGQEDDSSSNWNEGSGGGSEQVLGDISGFLIDFVIEQTGYPAELVDLDADLEADLGIDSIKKAQMFGEIGEAFNIAPPNGNVTLDDFSTLRHVIAFITQSSSASLESSTPKPVAEFNGNGFAHSTAFSQNGHGNLAEPTPDVNDDSDDALRDFLVNFVIEQTGYPADLVDLDADLEADLGIDSIKKAQMFGEIGEAFNVAPPDGSVTLDDFPTLRRVMAFIGNSRAKATNQVIATQPSPPVPPVNLSQTAQAATTKLSASGANVSARAGELEKFLIDFVIDQTGYPAELVDLDADLEADLGIDSIKKAQMFGEIGETFNIAPPDGNVTLDDFSTLRRVKEFMTAAIAQDGSGSATAVIAPDAETVQESQLKGDQSPTEFIRVKTSPESARTMRRTVFRLVPKMPSASPQKHVWGRRAIILGRNAASSALRKRLTSLRVDVISLDAGSTMQSAREAVEAAWRNGPCEHLFLMTGRDAASASYMDSKCWESRRELGVMIPFAVSQKWFELISEVQFEVTPTLIAAVNLGGDLGQSGNSDSIEGAALCGLLKAVQGESQQLRCLAVDFASDYAADQLVRDLLTEVEAKPEEIEVCYDRHQTRRVLRAAPQPASTLPAAQVAAGTTWIATGGARGVVGYVATQLGLHYGLKLHLVGSSPTPAIDPEWLSLSEKGRKDLKTQIVKDARAKNLLPADAWQKVERAIEIEQTLRNLRERGLEVEYHCCDVSDRNRVADLISKIQSKDGRIEGVIHGAGVESACKFGKKKWELVNRTVAAKVDGCAALMAALADQPPQYFIGFGSTSGRFGGVGQTDYSLANAMLVQLIANYRRQNPTCHAFAVDWTAWGEVGMAARPESKFALQAMNVQFMSPQEGVDHLIDELQSESDDTEIAIFDHPGAFSIHPTMSDYGSLDPTDAQSDPLRRMESLHPREVISDDDQTMGGDAYELGKAFGTKLAQEIRERLKLLADTGGVKSANAAFEIPAKLEPLSQVDSVSELEGMAAGAGVSIISLLALRRKFLDRIASSGRRLTTNVATIPSNAPKPSIDDLPLISSILQYTHGHELVASTIVSPVRDLFLLQHRLYKRPFLPAVVSMEILAEAASVHCPSAKFVELIDVDLVSGHSFISDSDLELRSQIRVDGDAFSGKISAYVDGALKSDLVTAKIRLADVAPEAPAMEIKNPTLGWNKFLYPESMTPLFHGPVFRTFEDLSFQHDGGRARLRGRPPLELAGSRSGTNWITPSSLLDGCLVCCLTYSYCMLEDRLEIPRRMGAVRLYRVPKVGELCKMRLYLRAYDANTTHYDFCVIGEDGRFILEVKDFQGIRIEGGVNS